MHNFPHDPFVSGWYQVAWSDELTPGSVRPLRYFDCDLVCFRTESGVLTIADAFCPHLGAHLGYGGTVEGECIRCPFHGWTFGADGRNVEIPYSSPGRMEVGVRPWEVREVDGIVLVWFGARGEAPAWEPPPFLPEGSSVDDFWALYPATTRRWDGVRFLPQVVTENSCDGAHFKYVHRAGAVPEIAGFTADGFRFRTEVAIRFGNDKGTTWATPNGPVDGFIVNEARGLGYIASVFRGFDTTYTCTATTPIDRQSSDHMATVWVPKVRGDGSPLDEKIRDRWANQQFSQHVADFPVWENMTYVEKPPFARDEAKVFRAIREWTDAMYAASAR